MEFLSFIFISYFLVVVDSQKRECLNPLKPNIVLMLMDDMGWGDLGSNGDISRETVNLDRLAKEGMLLTEFYAGNPLCSPSRAALLTGRLPIRNGFYTTNLKARNSYVSPEMVGGIPRSEILISELLAKVGYRNKIIGKWHLGHTKPEYWPTNRGFHEFFGSHGVHFGPWDDKTRPNVPVFRQDQMIGRYYENIFIDHKNQISNMTEWFTQEAINFIRQESFNENPFFLYWAPDTLHAPTYRSKKFIGRSVKNSSYGDALMEIDYSVNKIIETIQNDECLQNNTFVFFTSDNGPALTSTTDAGSSGPLLCGKQTTFEGGYREPAIAWWPGKIKSDSISRQVVTMMDLFATIVKMAGATVPKDRIYDSSDLSSLFFENKENHNTSMFFYRGDTLMAIRHGPYKAHYWTFATPPYELKAGIDFCPGQRVPQLTTANLTKHETAPILFHLFRDPSERYPINPKKVEYQQAIKTLTTIYKDHLNNLKPHDPLLNFCDKAAMDWSPLGCQNLNMCLPIPKSNPYFCQWPH